MSEKYFWEGTFARYRAWRDAAAKTEAERQEAKQVLTDEINRRLDEAFAFGSQWEQKIADAIFAKSERETGGLAALLTVEAKHQQAPPPAASDQTGVFRAMRNTQQSLAIYEREP